MQMQFMGERPPGWEEAIRAERRATRKRRRVAAFLWATTLAGLIFLLPLLFRFGQWLAAVIS